METLAATRTERRLLDRFLQFLYEETGMRLPPSKELMIETRLKKRFHELGLPDLASYLRHLLDEGGRERETAVVVDLMTTNKTDFFREEAHFHLLSNRILPEAMQGSASGGKCRFRLWSAAASVGAEAWSAAMLLEEAARTNPRLDWAILGTDISGTVVQRARRAIYPASDLLPVPKPLRDAYVMTGRDSSGRMHCRIAPELRARVRFARMNLVQFPYRIPNGLDVVMLRNVLIYFEPALQERIVNACAGQLRPGGHLIVGHSESMTVRQRDLTQVAPGVFRREGRR